MNCRTTTGPWLARARGFRFLLVWVDSGGGNPKIRMDCSCEGRTPEGQVGANFDRDMGVNGEAVHVETHPHGNVDTKEDISHSTSSQDKKINHVTSVCPVILFTHTILYLNDSRFALSVC